MNEIQKNILSIYAMAGAGSIMMLIPYTLIPFAGIACLLVALVTAYIYRMRADKESIMQSSMTYLIRTIWWSQLILTIGIGVFGAMIISNGDLSMIHSLTERAQSGVLPTERDIRAMQLSFVETNKQIIIIAASIGLLPYPLYLLYRIIRGVKPVLKSS